MGSLSKAHGMIRQEGITEPTKWGLSEVTSSTCMLARKSLKGTVMGKSPKPFPGAQHAGVLPESACTLMYRLFCKGSQK